MISRLPLEHLDDRRALDLALRYQLFEHRRLENAEPHPQADSDQDDTEQEGYAPAPLEELVAGERAEREDREVGEEETRRHAELRPGCDEAAIVMGACPFHRDQHRATPFAAHADPLDRPQDGQQNRAPDADRRVAGHKGDQEGGDAHQHQGGDQGRLAADAIAVMAEDRGPDRPAGKADEIGAEGGQGRGQRIRIREIELPEHKPGGGAVEKEIVPFDGRAYGSGDHRLAQFGAVLPVGKRPHCRRGHSRLPQRFGFSFIGPSPPLFRHVARWLGFLRRLRRIRSRCRRRCDPA
jgi:hypothetical protein